MSKQPKRVHGSMKNKIVATELLEERANCNFDQKELKNLLVPDKDAQRIQKIAFKDIEENPILQEGVSQKYYEMTRQEIQQMWMKKMHYLWFNKDRSFYFGSGITQSSYWFWYHFGQPPHGLHASMFTNSIETFCDDEQVAKWLPMTKNLDIIGCYAQTEIGHGSNVSGLETIAVFDKKTDEFVISTPTMTSTKWWPGDMGRFANHALVFAQLIIEDEDGTRNNYGVNPFIVQIRNRDTHKYMPGCECGDMGPKFGYHSKDNGWLTLNNVRIPRNQMPCRFVKVDRDGSVSIEGDLRIIYSTMLKTRFTIISAGPSVLLAVTLIACRYSVVRRQFKNISGQKEETKLLDYQTQQQKLLPLIASMFAQNFSVQFMKEQYEKLMQGIKNDNFDLLDLMHHYTSGMKAVYTQETFDGLINLRQSLGGAGYTAWSGIPRIIEDYSPLVTFEGDNTVMAQQSFNFILKQCKNLKKGKITEPAFPYLKELENLQTLKCSATKPEDFMNLNQIDEALKVNVGVQLSSVLKKMAASKVSKKDFINSLNALDIVKVSQDHIRYVTFLTFRERINKGDIKCPKILNILEKFCMLYGLNQLNTNSNSCYQCGYFSQGPYSENILEAIKMLNLEMRPLIIPILESAEIPDIFLASAIGNSYGDIYETHLEWAKNSRLNHTKLGDAIPDGYMEYIMPILKGKL